MKTRTVLKIIGATTFVLLAGTGYHHQPSKPIAINTTVKRVVDGDTIQIANGEKIRLIGVDTPEVVDPHKPVQCYGPEASAFTKQQLPPGTTIRLVDDKQRNDKYERHLAYVYKGSSFFNATLVKEGYARVLTIPPDTAHSNEFKTLENEAKIQHRGLWGKCS